MTVPKNVLILKYKDLVRHFVTLLFENDNSWSGRQSGPTSVSLKLPLFYVGLPTSGLPPSEDLINSVPIRTKYFELIITYRHTNNKRSLLNKLDGPNKI